ncbi:MAG TPA: hypothetical protein VMU14_17975, partial [Acidimicrobiales bacterium]|nr:hypothetical protein [Acidimicrobiales bacterium]
MSVNTQDNSSVFHLAFSVVRSSGQVVSVSNVALAVTQCSHCSSTAIAIQVDLVWPVPTVLTAQNVALAATTGCATCDALAAAFQFVVASPQQMTLSGEGRQEMAQTERQLAALQRSGLPASSLTASVDALAAQLGHVLATQLVPAHDQGEVDARDPGTSNDGGGHSVGNGSGDGNGGNGLGNLGTDGNVGDLAKRGHIGTGVGMGPHPHSRPGDVMMPAPVAHASPAVLLAAGSVNPASVASSAPLMAPGVSVVPSTGLVAGTQV